MATWNHDDGGYRSENKMGNTHTALGCYMLESAFGFGAVPSGNSLGWGGGGGGACGSWTQDELVMVLGRRLWELAALMLEMAALMLEMNTSAVDGCPPERTLNECALNHMHIKEIRIVEIHSYHSH